MLFGFGEVCFEQMFVKLISFWKTVQMDSKLTIKDAMVFLKA